MEAPYANANRPLDNTDINIYEPILSATIVSNV
jgi:hypothetical protein